MAFRLFSSIRDMRALDGCVSGHCFWAENPTASFDGGHVEWVRGGNGLRLGEYTSRCAMK